MIASNPQEHVQPELAIGGRTMFGMALPATRGRASGMCARAKRTTLLQPALIVAFLLPHPVLAQGSADTRAILERFAGRCLGGSGRSLPALSS